MQFSTRATRAGSAFLVFGILASMIPTGSGFVLAADNCPAPEPTGGSRGAGTFLTAALIAGGIGGLYAIATGAGGLILIGGKKKKKTKKQLEQERLLQQFERLDRFTRPSDAGSNPGVNH